MGCLPCAGPPRRGPSPPSARRTPTSSPAWPKPPGARSSRMARPPPRGSRPWPPGSCPCRRGDPFSLPIPRRAPGWPWRGWPSGSCSPGSPSPSGGPSSSCSLGPGLRRTLRAQSTGTLWAPASVKAWLAQRAIEGGDRPGARRWRPSDAQPAHLLLAALIDLQTGFPEEALKTLSPLVGQGSPRPMPSWRAPALLLAASAHLESGHPEEARALLERLILEQPGQREAIHDLQTLVKDTPPPPPPNPKKPPPPPPPRPSMGAQQDELEGLRQRLPKPPKILRRREGSLAGWRLVGAQTRPRTLRRS